MQIANAHPDVLTAEYRVAKRPTRRVLVDYNQNAFGKTLASIYSVRANEAAAVSTPVTWEEIEAGCEIGDFTVFNVPDRVARDRRSLETAAAAIAAASISDALERRPCRALRTRDRAADRADGDAADRSGFPKATTWTYEPKWDGFRCIAFRDRRRRRAPVEIRRIADALLSRDRRGAAHREGGALRYRRRADYRRPATAPISTPCCSAFTRPRAAFANSRVETPATYVLFDLLVTRAASSSSVPLRERRELLEDFVDRNFAKNATIRALPGDRRSPRWRSNGSAAVWRGSTASSRNSDVPYAFGSRDAAVKIKRSYARRLRDRRFPNELGRRDRLAASRALRRRRALDHVGFVGSMGAPDANVRPSCSSRSSSRPDLPAPRRAARAAGGAQPTRNGFRCARRSSSRSPSITSTARRFRHATRLLRWRPDKAPRQCTMDQLVKPTERSGSRVSSTVTGVPALTTIG